MSAPQKRQWGQSPPISEALPTEKELALNAALIEELKRQNNFEKPEDTERRVQVLKHLQAVTEEFVRQVGRRKGLSESVIQNAGGKVFTFGSYRLGVYGPGSDIDTIVVAPKHVWREDFFSDFEQVLRKMSPEGAIADLKAVPTAHVPIIKIEYRTGGTDISIDLIFTRMPISAIPINMELSDNNILRGLDETEVRSLNGPRVTDEILTLVPQVKTFRHALRAIKLWAQRRAVYANIIGFPGGVAWAMMVARICQLYPMAPGGVIVSKFFKLMLDWPWPRPVQLKNTEYEGPLPYARIWNPQQNHTDRRHIMPVITPAYPAMCATHNITHSTKQVIINELARAANIMNHIVEGKMEWKDLFEKHTFFTQDYKYYLSIISASRTKEAQGQWEGFIESKVRRLASDIDNSEAGVELAVPFIKGLKRVHRCKDEDEVQRVLQGDLSFQVQETETTDEASQIKEAMATASTTEPSTESNGHEINTQGVSTIYTTTFYVGIKLHPEAKSLDISYPVSDFKRMCTENPGYNPDINSIRVVHTRNYDLPADVFQPGETRPVRASKKAKRASKQSSQKRSFAETGMEEVDPGAKRRQSINGVATPANAT